ncbi:MAG: TIGR02266 family protein [Myxococcaceae bacterium]|nr:TIGR02266 family protein [Myxococcaceae bacterium]
MGEEKRHDERFPFVLKVEYSDRKQVADATENLSSGGLFIQTEQPWQVGDVVPLALSFPGLLDPIEIVGRVTWIRPALGSGVGGVGIAVQTDADRKRLEKLLALSAESGGTKEQAVPAGGFRVLIVEDNPHIIEMYSYVLKKLAANDLQGRVPLEVHFAPDGHHALTQLKETTFNLLMTDLYMPVMDGFQLVEKLRADEKLKKIPIVAISAGGRDAQEKAMSVGVDIYLRKPVRFAEVLETVKRLLNIK